MVATRDIQLQGRGARGASNYQLWLAAGHEGTIDDFLAQQVPPLPPIALTPTADGLIPIIVQPVDDNTYIVEKMRYPNGAPYFATVEGIGDECILATDPRLTYGNRRGFSKHKPNGVRSSRPYVVDSGPGADQCDMTPGMFVGYGTYVNEVTFSVLFKDSPDGHSQIDFNTLTPFCAAMQVNGVTQGVISSSVTNADDAQEGTIALDEGYNEVRLVWPAGRSMELVQIRQSAGGGCGPLDAPGELWVCQGDSITHGPHVDNGADTWPYLLSQQAGVDVLNLGLSNRQSAAADGTLAGSLNPHQGTYLAGANDWQLSQRTFAEAGAEIVPYCTNWFNENDDPDSHLWIITPLWCPSQGTVNSKGFSLNNLRDDWASRINANIAANPGRVDSLGRQRLHLVNGLNAMTNNVTRLKDAVLHPNSLGASEIGAYMRGLMAPFRKA